jgi:hypothetical protein
MELTAPSITPQNILDKRAKTSDPKRETINARYTPNRPSGEIFKENFVLMKARRLALESDPASVRAYDAALRRNLSEMEENKKAVDAKFEAMRVKVSSNTGTSSPTRFSPFPKQPQKSASTNCLYSSLDEASQEAIRHIPQDALGVTEPTSSETVDAVHFPLPPPHAPSIPTIRVADSIGTQSVRIDSSAPSISSLPASGLDPPPSRRPLSPRAAHSSSIRDGHGPVIRHYLPPPTECAAHRVSALKRRRVLLLGGSLTACVGAVGFVASMTFVCAKASLAASWDGGSVSALLAFLAAFLAGVWFL